VILGIYDRFVECFHDCFEDRCPQAIRVQCSKCGCILDEEEDSIRGLFLEGLCVSESFLEDICKDCCELIISNDDDE